MRLIPWKTVCERINEAIQRVKRVDAKHWKRDPELLKLYNLAQSRVINGNNFGSWGDWYTMLDKEPLISKVSSLSRKGYYDEELHNIVARAIRNCTSMKLYDWQRSKELEPIFSAIRRRKFFQHGGWYQYLKNHHKHEAKKGNDNQI